MAFKKEIIEKFHTTRNFKTNTLDLIVIELKFDEIPEAEFKKLNLKFYNKIIKDFQYKQEIFLNEIKGEINLSEETCTSNFSRKPGFIYKNSNAKTEKSICVKSNSLSIEYNDPNYNNYDGFEKFQESFIKYLNLFKEEYKGTFSSDLSVTRLGLRKINKINKSLLMQYNIPCLGETTYFRDDKDHYIFKEIVSKENNCTAVIRAGIVSDDYFLIDLDIFQDEPSKLLENYSDTFKSLLNDFNLKIFNIYCFLVGDKFINDYLDNKDKDC